MLLDSLMASTEALPIEEYRALLRQAAEAGVPADHPDVAEGLASLARRLTYSAEAVRGDHELMVRAVQLERRYDLDELAKDQRELERVCEPDSSYHRTGGTLDRAILRLTRRLDAAQASDRAEILGEIEDAKERGMKLTRARRTVEDKVIAGLAARDRAAAFKAGHRRLFPAGD